MIQLSKAVISLMLGFILSIIIGSILIPYLKKLKMSQNVSKHLNIRHLKKNGTPTMGGIIFVFSTIIIMFFLLLLNKIKLSINFILLLFVFISYAILGFIDDYIKIRFHNNKGLSTIFKFTIQIIIALIFFIFFIYNGNNTTINLYFINIDLKFLYGIFLLFIFTASSNAVNITDGLDGLAAGLCAISFLTYGIIAFESGYVLGNEEIGIFSFVLSGSLLGFLFFNFYPAKVFMGDLGSLSLGSTLGAISILLKNELSLILIAIVYIIETISSFIQIISIRYFNKKIFLKSPLHHHFEEKGFKEVEIIKIFYMFGLIFSLIAIILFVWL